MIKICMPFNCTYTQYILKRKKKSITASYITRPHKTCNNDFRLHQEKKTCGGNQCPNSKPSAQTVCPLIHTKFVRSTLGLGCWHIGVLKAILAASTYIMYFVYSVNLKAGFGTWFNHFNICDKNLQIYLNHLKL